MSAVPWRLVVCVLLPFAAGFHLSYLLRTINALIAGQLATEFGIGNQLAFGNTDSDLVKALRESTGQTTNRAGQRMVERTLNVQPTITVRPGWPLRFIVHKDLIMRPYRGPNSLPLTTKE